MLKNLLLALSATVLTLLLCEAGMRVVVTIMHRDPIVVSNEESGWSGRPGLEDTRISVAQGSFTATTDDSGQRITDASSAAAGTDRRPAIVIVGDSFAFGLNVDDTATFPWRIAQAKPDRRVINLGVAGWGSDQELLGLERFLAARKPVSVRDIVVLVYENDFRDVQRHLEPFLGYHKPVFSLEDGRINRGTFNRSFYERLMDYSRLAWAIRIKTTSLAETSRIQSDPGAEMVLACLASIRQLAESKGARVHVFAHRRARRPSLITPAVWRDFLTRSGAVDITDVILAGSNPDPIGYDGGHWSGEGHRRAANFILASL